MTSGQLPPIQWTLDELEADRQEATDYFREQRMSEPLEIYLEAFDNLRGSIEEFLELTVDLTDFSELTPEILSDQAMMGSLRYLAGPPISLDDLKTLVNANLSLRALQKDPTLVERLVSTVLAGLDRRRFPWIGDQREPEPGERDAAIIASAALMAAQHTATHRRNDGKELQEAAVQEALFGLGFELIAIPNREIPTPTQAPRAGQFTREVMLGIRKADLVVGLWDGRIMAIECKVSNSFVNSIKRLNNDAAVKADYWRTAFGERYVVPTAVLSGLFKRHHLVSAQSRHLTLIWEHRLEDLTGWIDRAR